MIAYADAARVVICDGRVCPYILIGGSLSNPALRPVFASGDPAVGDNNLDKRREDWFNLLGRCSEASDITELGSL
ncbi:hypothetical protein M1O16_03170 [Dehalococcoidia bacterium]|nr:hypothetical protein [Dehalococcoidia bacterium]